MRTPVYLDYAATTPVDPRVAAAMVGCLTMAGNFGNAASRSHMYGWKAEEAVENARAEVAGLIGADPREIVWVSGATEANNLALKGVAEANAGKGRHLITSLIEHKSVLDTCKYLESRGFEVSYLTPERDGRINPASVAKAMRADTILVSLMHVNNEIGVINDIASIGELCHERGVILHSDAAQSPAKVALDVHLLNVDLLSISAHKMYGPKGIGALYVRRSSDVKIAPQMHGGGHERGMRSGTLPTHQIVGLGQAAKYARAELKAESKRILALRERFLQQIDGVEQKFINGSLERRVPGNLNISFGYVDGEALLTALRELAVSTGSACMSVSVEPSYVLRAIGVEPELAHSALRISFGRFTTEEEVDFAASKLVDALAKLREISPQWRARPLVVQ